MNYESPQCNICSVDNYRAVCTAKSLYSDDMFRIVKCNVCGLVYVNPRQIMKDKKLDDVDSVDYFNMTRSRDDCIYGRVMNKIEMIAEKGRLLDVGCATGGLLMKARDRGWDVAGVEINKKCAEYGCKANNLNIECGELSDAHFPDESFDVVSMVHVIEHIYDPKALISEVGRVLKKGGLLYIETPNFNNYFVRAAKSIGFIKKIDDIDPTGHPYMFTKKSIIRLMGVSGFKIIKAEDGMSLLKLQNIAKKTKAAVKIMARLCTVAGGGSSLIVFGQKL